MRRKFSQAWQNNAPNIWTNALGKGKVERQLISLLRSDYKLSLELAKPFS